MSLRRVRTTSCVETEALAAELALGLHAPLVVLLEGELGAGKTTFVRGFVGALPGGESVTVQSPTFALARTYPTSPPVHHLDLYRLAGRDSLEELGLLELLLDERAICLVEWPGALSMPVAWMRVRLAPVEDSSEERTIEVEFPNDDDA